MTLCYILYHAMSGGVNPYILPALPPVPFGYDALWAGLNVVDKNICACLEPNPDCSIMQPVL
jgi:hypothetical protein